MNELELLQLFRDDVPEPSTDAWLRARAALAAAREGTAVDHRSPDAVRSPDRRSRRSASRRMAGVGLTGVAAVTAMIFGLTGVFGHAPNAHTGGTPPSNNTDTTTPGHGTGPIRTVGFVLVAHGNGTLTLTMSQMLDPAALQQALEQHGVPVLVETNTYCTSHPAAPDPSSIGVLKTNPPFPLRPSPHGLVPTAGGGPESPVGGPLGAHFETVINPEAMPRGTELFFDYLPGHSLLFAGLLDEDSYTCGGQPPPPGPQG